MTGIGTFPKRKQNHEPMLTATEIADELGIPRQSMLAYAQHRNGPKRALVSKGKSYFKPSEVRRWWKQMQEQES